MKIFTVREIFRHVVYAEGKMRIQAFGHARENGVEWKRAKDDADHAGWLLLIGCISVAVFLGSCILRGSGIATAQPEAVQVMAQTAQELPTDGVPHGYLDGEWNLWEYLSDVLTALFVGG